MKEGKKARRKDYMKEGSRKEGGTRKESYIKEGLYERKKNYMKE